MISTEVAREARKIPETLADSICAMSVALSRSVVDCCRRLEPIAWTRYRADNVPIAAYKIEMGESPAK